MDGIGRVRRILSKASVSMEEAREALEAAKEEFDLISTRLEHLEAVNSRNIEEKENKVVAQAREVAQFLNSKEEE